MIYLCLSISLIILTIAVIFAIKNRNNMNKWISCVLLGIFFSTFFMVLPTGWIKEGKEVVCEPLYAALSALLYSFKTLGGRQDIAQLESAALSGILKTLYICINYISFALAPILASSLILSFIGDTGDKMHFAFKDSKKCCVFSDINENSLSLAKGILKNSDKATIVFCNTKKADKDDIAKAKKLGAINLYKNCENMKIGKRFKKYEFFAISENEDNNIKTAESIISKHSDSAKPIIINAFVESGTNVKFLENVLNSKSTNNIELRCIDEIAFFCNNLVFTHPLYNTKKDTISVAIIGCGRTGMRMLKTAYWAGQIDGYNLKIRVYDKNADKCREQFHRQCPGLKDEKTIEFIKTDVDTLDFKEKILDKENSLDATYIVVCMGDDQLNLSVSEELYRIYRRELSFNNEQLPEIFARVRSEVKSTPYFENVEFLKERHIHLFGTTESVFSDSTIFNTELENLAFAVHLAYWERLGMKHDSKEYAEVRKNFMTVEYDRRSSMAAALHIPAKLYMCNNTIKTDENILTQENIKIFDESIKKDAALLERLAINEHKRWNAFMLSEGYQAASIDEMLIYAESIGNHKDDLSMLHPCITEWEALDELEKIYNKKYIKNKNFKYYDKNIVKSIPQIWEVSQKANGGN